VSPLKIKGRLINIFSGLGICSLALSLFPSPNKSNLLFGLLQKEQRAISSLQKEQCSEISSFTNRGKRAICFKKY